MPLERFAPRERQTLRYQETCARSREQRLALREADVCETATSVGALSDRELLLIGAALYWAEGEKNKPWRVSDRVTFINSDPDLILLLLRWLDLVGIEPQRLVLRLSIHESADVQAAEHRWSEITAS
jgi:hypothetical protein